MCKHYRRVIKHNAKYHDFLTLAGTSHFAILHGTGEGVGTTLPPRVWSLIELELRGKNERVRLHERKPMVPNSKV